MNSRKMKNKTICWLFIFILMIHHNNDITAETIACLFFFLWTRDGVINNKWWTNRG